MERGLYDKRPINQVINELMNERTTDGDTMILAVTYKRDGKPELKVEFGTKDPALKSYDPEEVLTSYLPDTPNWPKLDGEGEPVGRERGGFDTWKEFFNHPHGLVRTIRNFARAGSRRFEFVETKE